MIYLFCERCHEKRLFVPAEEQPPFDPHASMCCECGYSFGYTQIETRHVGGRIDVVTRPVLELHVVARGLEEFRRERTEQLRAMGLSIEHQRAQQMFEATEGNPKERRMLTSATQGTVSAELAEKILRPNVPSRE